MAYTVADLYSADTLKSAVLPLCRFAPCKGFRGIKPVATLPFYSTIPCLRLRDQPLPAPCSSTRIPHVAAVMEHYVIAGIKVLKLTEYFVPS